MEEASLVISILAIIGSGWSLFSTIKYSRISLIHTLQQMVLQKANDCNLLWKEVANKHHHPDEHNSGRPYIPTISEIIISIQLLDNSLKQYSQRGKREFFLKQFWIQLDTSLRYYFKAVNPPEAYNKVTTQQIYDIQNTFGHLFNDY